MPTDVMIKMNGEYLHQPGMPKTQINRLHVGSLVRLSDYIAPGKRVKVEVLAETEKKPLATATIYVTLGQPKKVEAPVCPAAGPEKPCPTPVKVPVPYPPVPVPVPAKVAVVFDYKRDGPVNEGSFAVLKVGDNWSYGAGVYLGSGHKAFSRRFQADLGVNTGRQVLDLESFRNSDVDIMQYGVLAQLMKEGRGRIHLGGRIGGGYTSLSSVNNTNQTARDSVTHELVKSQECNNGTYKKGGIHAFVDAIVEGEVVKDKLSVIVNGGVGYHGANKIIHGGDNQEVEVIPRYTKRVGVGVKLRF
jgi:hypothetical protein